LQNWRIICFTQHLDKEQLASDCQGQVLESLWQTIIKPPV